MPQRDFYIIGHNPNSIEEVEKCLKAGANAIEPDVSYHKDMPEKFYVHEDIAQIPNVIEHLFWEKFPSLKEYLSDLKNFIKANQQYNIKLIDFDLKGDYEYDINELYTVIRENFSVEYPDVKIITTMNNPKKMKFLSNLKDQKPNESLGLDENVEPEVVHEFFKDTGLRYDFAAGSSLFSTTTGKFRGRIERAIEIRNNRGFNYVWPWCVNTESHMKEYLDMGKETATGIDAILTDEPDRLKALIDSDEYKDRFRL